MRVRGTAHQIFERYLAMAREAETGGDRVSSESYYQHAEHYYRINNASRDRNAQESSRPAALSDIVTRDADTGSTEIGIDRAQSPAMTIRSVLTATTSTLSRNNDRNRKGLLNISPN
jgi:hypothetical protein